MDSKRGVNHQVRDLPSGDLQNQILQQIEDTVSHSQFRTTQRRPLVSRRTTS
jgi:mRNA degradation ribonuclease J1/J2